MVVSEAVRASLRDVELLDWLCLPGIAISTVATITAQSADRGCSH